MTEWTRSIGRMGQTTCGAVTVSKWTGRTRRCAIRTPSGSIPTHRARAGGVFAPSATPHGRVPPYRHHGHRRREDLWSQWLEVQPHGHQAIQRGFVVSTEIERLVAEEAAASEAY